MAAVPFPPHRELYSKFRPGPPPCTQHLALGEPSEITRDKVTVPGVPYLELHHPRLAGFLIKDLTTRRLDQLHPILWLVAKQDSSHISSLTHQIVRGRNIVITEEPELHLVWIYDRIFVKPIPKYLLSHTFWTMFITGSTAQFRTSEEAQETAAAARGLLRSYHWLVQHKSDFRLAKQHGLVPQKTSYPQFALFIRACNTSILDSDVNPRYHFGELRLIRLNLWTRLCLRQFAFLKVSGQYGAVLSQYYGPILFVLGVLSVALSACQVGLAVQPSLALTHFLRIFDRVSQALAVVSLLIVAMSLFLLVAIVIMLLVRELMFALKDLLRQKSRAAQSGV